MISGADVIVVGGGTCGSVLAARLADRPGCSVALLESGPSFLSGPIPPEILDPTVLPVGPSSDWAWRYNVVLNARRSSRIVRGRLIGGSGAVNGCYFVRAPADDFADWPGLWSWDQVLPVFRRLETDHDFAGPLHGDRGPIPVRRDSGSALSPFSTEFSEAALTSGFDHEPDKNGAGAGGIGPVPLNMDSGVRVNTAMAYLAPRMGWPNLRIHAETTVRRILFDRSTAVGVELERRGERSEIRGGRVVLCAGAVESAALLMRSGVGDPDHLRSIGIYPVHRLPGVGRGLADHLEVGVPYRLSETYVSERRFVPLQVALNVGGIEIRPYTSSFGDMVPESGVAQRELGVALMSPISRGRIELVSPYPEVAPRIDYGYLDAADDRARMRSAIGLANRLLSDLSARGVVHTPAARPADGTWLDTHLGTSQHMTGTCRLGDPNDERAVVDERCTVIGLDGLSVVDTSIMPNPLTRGVHATAVMIAERAAELMPR